MVLDRKGRSPAPRQWQTDNEEKTDLIKSVGGGLDGMEEGEGKKDTEVDA